MVTGWTGPPTTHRHWAVIPVPSRSPETPALCSLPPTPLHPHRNLDRPCAHGQTPDHELPPVATTDDARPGGPRVRICSHASGLDGSTLRPGRLCGHAASARIPKLLYPRSARRGARRRTPAFQVVYRPARVAGAGRPPAGWLAVAAPRLRGALDLSTGEFGNDTRYTHRPASATTTCHAFDSAPHPDSSAPGPVTPGPTVLAVTTGHVVALGAPEVLCAASWHQGVSWLLACARGILAGFAGSLPPLVPPAPSRTYSYVRATTPLSVGLEFRGYAAAWAQASCTARISSRVGWRGASG
jgi:hypothetical protein